MSLAADENIKSVSVPDIKPFQLQANSVIADIDKLSVIDTASHAQALKLWSEADIIDKAVEAKFEEPVKASNAIHKFLTGLRATFRAPIEAAKALAKRKADTWANEERRRAEEEARAKAEAARKAEEERKLQEALDAPPDEQDAILAEEVTVPYIAPTPQIAKVDGISERTSFEAVIVDLQKLVKYVASRPEELALIGYVKDGKLESGQVALNQRARSMRREGEIVPGVMGVKKTSMAQRR